MLSLLLKKDAVKEVLAGTPWVFTSMIAMTSELEMAEPGSLVQILDDRARPLAIGYLNPKLTLACRVLSLQPKATINHIFFEKLFEKALTKRQKFLNQPYYRLVHSESDGVPGLVVDRFGDTL